MKLYEFYKKNKKRAESRITSVVKKDVKCGIASALMIGGTLIIGGGVTVEDPKSILFGGICVIIGFFIFLFLIWSD
jgi:hypothetical protein